MSDRDYSKAADIIADAIAKIAKPLTQTQRLVMAGSVALLLDSEFKAGCKSQALSAQPAAPVDEREAFEASVIARNSAEYDTPRFLLELNSAEEYATVRIQGEWIGWQARAALQEPTK